MAVLCPHGTEATRGGDGSCPVGLGLKEAEREKLKAIRRKLGLVVHEGKVPNV